MERLTFEHGEIRRIEFAVNSTVPNESIVITSAVWRITKDDAEMQNGVCAIRDNIIELIIELQETGYFTLEITAQIPPETIIERVQYRVV